MGTLAASAALAGCGGGATSTTGSTHAHTTSVRRKSGAPAGQGQSAAKQLTLEEMREYDANEGRCHDDGGTVRDVGTIDAYCAFPSRSSDFHLIESAQAREPSGEEE